MSGIRVKNQLNPIFEMIFYHCLYIPTHFFFYDLLYFIIETIMCNDRVVRKLAPFSTYNRLSI